MISWILSGLLTAPPPARVEIRYETQPSGFQGHWTLEDVRPGVLPGLSVRGPLNQEQLLVIEVQHPEESLLQFKAQILEDQEIDGEIRSTAVLSPAMITEWEREASIFTSDRQRLKRFGRNRWTTVQVKLSVTAWPQSTAEGPESAESAEPVEPEDESVPPQ